MEMGLPGSTEDLTHCVGPEEEGCSPTELKSKNSVGEYSSSQG